MPQFLEKIAEVLEVPSVTPEYAFRSAPGWSSLMGFALIVLLVGPGLELAHGLRPHRAARTAVPRHAHGG